MKQAKRDENFRKFTSRVARNYYERERWSTFELEMRDELKKLGYENKKDYLHNFKVGNPMNNDTYEIDFFFPERRLCLEVDGSVWHGRMGNADLKDRLKDWWLEKLGFEIIRMEGEIFKGEELHKLLQPERD